jgi:hypothetical protein
MSDSNKHTVAVITMPWGQPIHPNLLMGNLHAVLENHVSVQSFSFHLQYLRFILDQGFSLGSYQSKIGNYGLGDYIFRPVIFDFSEESELAYLRYLEEKGVAPSDINEGRVLSNLSSNFLDQTMSEIGNRDTIIMCPMYRELMPSLAFAKRFNESYPDSTIIIAGEVCEGEIANGILNNFPFVKYVMAENPESQVLQLYGGRSNDCKEEKVGLDHIDTPNFDEYYSRIEQLDLKNIVGDRTWVPYETSRGCWWAEKSKCTFCALTKTNPEFRRKKVDTVVSDLRKLSSRYRATKFQFFDWITPQVDLEVLYSAIEALKIDFTLYVQSRVQITKEQITLLRRVGAVIRLGVESLDTRTLRLMKKGSTALQNIRALKWCAEQNVRTEWNILHSFPGEHFNTYDQLKELLPSLYHLYPPSFNRFRLQRLSPMFDLLGEHKTLKPLPWYDMVYDFIHDDARASIVEEFVAPELGNAGMKSSRDEVEKMIDEWNAGHQNAYRKLQIFYGQDFGKIVDLRYETGRIEYELTAFETIACQVCDYGASLGAIRDKVKQAGLDVSSKKIQEFLDDMVRCRVFYEESGTFLCLALNACKYN